MIVSEAKRRIVSEEMKKIAEKEGRTPDFIMRGVASGRIVIPKNVRRDDIIICGIGEGLPTKVNANIGTSPDYVKVEEELEKLKVAVEHGADTVMDLSIGGDIRVIRRRIIENSSVPIGTVPIYQAGIEAAENGSIAEMTSDSIFNAVREHASDGVDFMTVHCGMTRGLLENMKRSGRILNLVSRGGAFMAAWMIETGRENPLFQEFDYLLEIAREFDVTLSLGDAMRPGCLADASDELQFEELITLAKLVERARERDVQVIVEGPGHLPLDHIWANVRLEKDLCKGAPFYVLGPLVTDIAPGYDHWVGAIGGAVAAWAGADFLCYLTPAEHLCLPSIEEVREGVIATKIAAHVGDIAKGMALQKDLLMAEARRKLDWGSQFNLAIDPGKARSLRNKRPPALDPKTCAMCGKWCAIKIVEEHLKKVEKDL
ncbi:MAG: phosphomethylpyrimidine synthase ThiC [Candidatus Hadarchaeales archaeon]